MKSKSILAAAFTACALFAGAAHAAKDISSPTQQVLQGGVASQKWTQGYKNNNKDNFFNDVFQFSLDEARGVSFSLTSSSPSAATGLNLTGFSLYGADDHLILNGNMRSTGARDEWDFTTHLGKGNYYLKVSGSLVSTTGGTYAANGRIFAPVPEPTTYAMLLGGLALVGGIAARRRAKAA
ncbi:FxDxF family PEP-CTERM protein [Massilia sp. BJB1822]|uniref:FxDxF family PEP-CTERM protein n=1 Tax=Massilia sp. BJB1822 TaxID=2744470 RepID=UPI001594BE35|nr:FxDxF family PEP-CTERM protein [Massilia sp. BJB1822]NVD99989.1 PEP-CTERM sorting domain-containing protein [Massilia sp. BJB1822]